MERSSTSTPPPLGASLLQNYPHEILSHIFMFCIPPEGVSFGTLRSIVSAPHTLSLVCSWWRRVTFASPFIWATLSIRSASQGFEDYEGALLFHLSKSQEVPLTVNASISTYPDEDITPHTGLFHLISKHSTRIRHFTLETFASDIWMQMMGIMNQSRSGAKFVFPIDNLTFKFTAFGHDDIERIRSSIENVSFPGLHSLSIVFHEFGRTITHEWPSLPWSQLTSLSFICHDDADIPHIISRCCQLKSLSIGLYDTSQYSQHALPFWFTAKTEITHPKLTKLTLCITQGFRGYAALNRMLSLFSCPSLTSLSIVPDFEGGIIAASPEEVANFAPAPSIDAFSEAVITFVTQKSKCLGALTHLKVRDVLMTEKSLKTLVLGLSSLRELELSVYDVFEFSCGSLCTVPHRDDLKVRTLGEITSIDRTFFLDGASEEEEMRLRRIRYLSEGRSRLWRDGGVVDSE
ncbi:hypothetical protein L218DRAFT_300607 [Marasmius fiardii PR-910]|nr:hypothetical protein L218DRAFT_300607 [Marasmius fiardii PR-910]